MRVRVGASWRGKYCCPGAAPESGAGLRLALRVGAGNAACVILTKHAGQAHSHGVTTICSGRTVNTVCDGYNLRPTHAAVMRDRHPGSEAADSRWFLLPISLVSTIVGSRWCPRNKP